jgi:WD40 repeat protein
MEDPAHNQSSDDADPSPPIQQDLKGDDNQAIGQMKDSTAIGKIVGNVIYNYYYREDVNTAIDDTAESAEDDPLPCPYRGLFHFGPGDAEYFFGRESFVEELVRATQTRNFIPLLGASGSGKSSVVLAGLVPKLQKAGHWQFTHFRPGADPFHALALALVPLYVNNLDETERIRQARNLAGYFRTGEVLLADVFAQIQQNFPTDRVLLIADQFEELYTLCTDETTRRNFLDRLLAGIAAPVDRSHFAPVLIATMRVDFLGNALSYPPLVDVLQNADLKLGSMNRTALTEAIEQPAQKLKVTFEAGLVERILGDVEAEPGTLPLLEFALTELWQRRSGKQLTHAAYEAIGEVQGALGRHANQEYAKFKDEADRERVRRIFIQLVRPGEGAEDTRRIATKAELGEQNWSLVKQLADARLVVTSRNGADRETVEVVHEALIRNWGELRGWMEIDRVFRAWQERLRGAMRQWEETQQDEGSLLRGAALAEAVEQLRQRPEELVAESGFIERSLQDRERIQQAEEKAVHEKKRQQQILIGVMGIGLLLTSGAAIFSLFQVQQVQRQRVEQLAANAKVLLANHQTVDAVIHAIAAKGLSQSVFIQFPDYPQFTLVEESLSDAIAYNRERNQLFYGRELGDDIDSVAYSPDGNRIISDGVMERAIYNSLTGSRINPLSSRYFNDRLGTYNRKERINPVAYSPDGKYIVSSNSDNTMKIRDAQTGASIGKPLTGHKDSINSMMYSSDGKYIVSGSSDNTVRIWDAQTGLSIGKPLIGHGYNGQTVSAVAYGPDNKHIVSGNNGGGDGGSLHVWEPPMGALVGEPWQGHKGSVSSVAYSLDGKHIVSGGGDNTIRIWNAKTGMPVGKPLQGHKGSVSSVAYSPDGKHIVSGGYDNTIRIWNAETGIPVGKPLFVNEDYINSVAYSPDGKHIVSGGYDNTIRIWNAETGIPVGKPLFVNEDYINSVAYSPDGKHIVSGGYENTIQIWNAETGRPVGKPLLGHKDYINSVAYSPDGKHIVSGDNDKTIRIWSAETGVPVGKPLLGHKYSVSSVAYSPDGKHIISSGADNVIRIWDAQTGVPISEPLQDDNDKMPRFQGQTTDNSEDIAFAGINSVAYSPDGSHVVSGSNDGMVRLWDISSKSPDVSWKDSLSVACNQLRYHPSLNEKETDVAREAKQTCEQYVWKK